MNLYLRFSRALLVATTDLHVFLLRMGHSAQGAKAFAAHKAAVAADDVVVVATRTAHSIIMQAQIVADKANDVAEEAYQAAKLYTLAAEAEAATLGRKLAA